MEITLFVTVLAIIAGPILAVQVQKTIERIGQKREEQRRVFMTLMTTRARPLLPEHVNALNMIDVVFSGKGLFTYIFFRKHKKDKAVVEAWATLNDHFCHYPPQPSVPPNTQLPDAERVAYKTQCDTWGSTKDEKLIDLLAKMAESLGYHFDKVRLKRGAYTPQNYGDVELDQLVIRKGLTELFLGNRPIPINVVQVNPSGAAEPVQPNTAPEIPSQDGDTKKLLQ